MQQAILQFIGRQAREAQFGVVDHPANGSALGRKEDAGEHSAILLPTDRDSEKIGVLREQDTTDIGRPLQEILIRCPAGSIILSCQHVDPVPTQALRNARRNMHIHIGRERHPRGYPSAVRMPAAGASPEQFIARKRR